MTRTMLTTQLFAVAAMLLVTVGALPAAAQTFDAALEAYVRGGLCHRPCWIPELRRAGQRRRAVQSRVHVGQRQGCARGRRRGGAVVPPRRRAGQRPRAVHSRVHVRQRRGRAPRTDAEAVRWYRLAAEQGYALAQSILGFMYAKGEGVPEDDVTAYAWLNIAAAQGQSSANESKEHVAKHMTQPQVAKAQKLSREYWTRYVIPFQ